MASRPDKNPGQYKTSANRAGSTEFVRPELVSGTLRAGFDIAGQLDSPFSRAAYMMFLIAEVHPFTDGNGRIARIMMNAELDAGGEVRIIIPTVYRDNYLSALRAGTFGPHFGALIAMLRFAQRYTARVDFSNRQTAETDLQRTHAFRDSSEAESAGVRLTLP
jgi:fido (protein-threonine AMPylation protein)